jgi:hypothetical protein
VDHFASFTKTNTATQHPLRLKWKQARNMAVPYLIVAVSALRADFEPQARHYTKLRMSVQMPIDNQGL